MAFMDSSVLLMASLSAAIMAGALVYQSLLPGNGPCLRLWGGGVMLLVFHTVAFRWLSGTEAPEFIRIVVSEGSHLLGAILLVAGSWMFCERPIPRFALWVTGGCGALWLLMASLIGFPADLLVFPIHAVVGGMMVMVAVTMWRHGRLPHLSAQYLALSLLGWGGSVIVFPMMMALPEWRELTYRFDVMAGQAFGMLVAIGLLVVALRRQSEQIDAARQQAIISELAAAEQAGKMRRILDVMPDAVISVNSLGDIQEFNPAAERVFGYAAFEVLGKPLAMVIPASWDAGSDSMAAASGLASLASVEVDGLRRNGLRVPLAIAVSTARQSEGDLHVIVARDITEARLTARLGEFLHHLEQKVLRGIGHQEFAREVCRDLSDIFDIPQVSLIERVEQEEALALRSCYCHWGAPGDEGCESADLKALWEQLLAGGGVACGILHEVIRTGMPALVRRGERLAAHMDGLPPEAQWSFVLPVWLQNDVSALLVLVGDGQSPAEPLRQRLETVAARLGAVQQQVLDQRRLRLQGTAMAAAANAIFITDRNGRIEWVNDAFTRLSGYGEKDIIGQTPAFLRSGVQNGETYQRLWETILDGRIWRGEMVERRKDGTMYTVDQTVAPIVDDSGSIAHFVAIHEDVTERKRAEERILYLSNYDTLTRLPNRVLFRDHLYQAVTKARSDRSALAVMFIDLDRFSRVNDTLGHEVGDQLLMTIASRINAVAAPFAETVARIGGDEFAVIQSHLPNADTAATLARKIIDEVGKPVDLDGLEVRVGANVGIAIFPQDGEDPDHLIKNADMAMYRAIRSESESYFFFSNDMNAEARIRLSLEGDLRRAIDNGDLTLFFQPQVDVKTRRVVGVEALLRWNHPEQGAISPARFIPVAEDSGLILPIGDWVLQEAMRQSRAWQLDGLPSVTMAINISAVQFRQKGLVQRVRDVADSIGLDPRKVELELTESMLMQDAREAVQVLSELSEMGAQLAIDDFGTGYSSLSYLKQFPVDKLKLDQSFVRHMTTEHNDAVIARATINLGHSLGLEVIAEGVETEEQYTYLLHEGCDVIQGYLFGRPMAADALANLLREQAASGGVFFPHIRETSLEGFAGLNR